MKVAILCGGQATRMRPLTDTIPKILLPVKGQFFAVRQLELLWRHGLTEVVYCTGHLGDQVEDVLGDGSQFGMTFTYSREGEARLGTGGALRRALPLLGHDPFMVLYGDSYLDCNYREVLNRYHWAGTPCLMTTYQGVDYGLSIVHPWALWPWRAHTPVGLGEMFAYWTAHQMASTIAMDRPWAEIGSKAGLAALEASL